MNVALSDRP